MVTIHELEYMECRVLDVMCAQHVLCVVFWGGEGHSGSDLPGKFEANPSCFNWGGGGQEAATHLDTSRAAGLCIVSMLYAAVFCSILSR